MSYNLNIVASRDFAGVADKHVRVGGSAGFRKIDDSFIGGWSEMHVGFLWRVVPLVAPADLPATNSLKSELYWGLGIQSGSGSVWNGRAGVVSHSIGIKPQSEASADTTIETTAGGNLNISTGYQGVHVQNGVVSTESPIGSMKIAAEPDIRNLVMLRVVRDTTWGVYMLKGDGDNAADQDYSLSDVHSLFSDNPTWSDLVIALTPSGYAQVHVLSGITVDVGTYGEFDRPYFSWNCRFLECELSAVFGRVIA